VICPNCRGEDYDGDGITDIRVYVDDLPNFPAVLQEVASLVPQPHFPDDYYVNAPMFLPTFSGYRNPTTGFQLPGGCWPLVATEDFFKWGVNVGVWKHAFNGGAPNSMNPNDTPMLFPSTREPPWGTVAIASARVGLSTANEGFPLGGLALPNTNGSYLCQFSDKGNRSNWCQASLQNLYYADVRATLAASKNQVNDFDLDEDILQGTPVGMLNGQVIDMGSGLSYLWGAILASNRINRNNWMDRFNGQADPRVGQALSNMRKRNPADDNRFTGPPFDYGSSQLNQVVEH
jgi:hypothetical protein